MAYRYTLDTRSYTNQTNQQRQRKTNKNQLTDMMMMMMTMHSNNNQFNNCSDWKDDHTIVKFKIFLEEEQRLRTKTIKLPLQTLSIDHLEAQIAKCFKVEPEDLKRMTLCHQDEEKGMIITTAISSDEELHSAISAFVASKHTVCLRVTMKNSSPPKKENEATTPAVVGADANSESCSRSNATVSDNALTTVDKAEDERMSSLQLSEIEAKGFANKRQNIRLLKKHTGNVEEVIQVLTELSAKRQKRIEKRKSAIRLPDDEPSKRGHEAINNKNAQPEVKLEEITDESSRATSSISATDDEKFNSLLTDLEAKGFTNKRQNIRLLKKHNEDVDKVTQVLMEGKTKKRLLATRCRAGAQDETIKIERVAIDISPEVKLEASNLSNGTCEAIVSIPVADENLDSRLRALEIKGFAKKKQNSRLLRKHNGDVDRVVQVLTNMSAKRQERMVMNATDDSSFDSALCELEAKGFSDKRLNIKLLKKNDHNVDKVIQVLTQISEKRQEKRKNRVSKLQEAFEELSPLLSELETKGFTNKRKNIRLLKKHDNDIGKVLQLLSDRRQAILARREARLTLKGTKQEQQINQAA